MSRLPQQLDRLANETFVTNRRAVQLFGLTLVLYTLLAVRLMLVALALRLGLDELWYLLLMGVAVTQFTLIFCSHPGRWGSWRRAGPPYSASAAKPRRTPYLSSAAGHLC